MDPSTCPESTPPYPGFTSMTLQQNKIPSQKSSALIGCGITLIATSASCLIPLFILLCRPLVYGASAWFVFNVLYLLMAMLCVYGGCSVAERHQIIVCTMIMGILATVGTVPVVIGFPIAFTYPRAEDDIVQVTVIISSVLSIINIILAITIAIIACKKTCQCCQYCECCQGCQCCCPAFHRMDRQGLTSNMA